MTFCYKRGRKGISLKLTLPQPKYCPYHALLKVMLWYTRWIGEQMSGIKKKTPELPKWLSFDNRILRQLEGNFLW